VLQGHGHAATKVVMQHRQGHATLTLTCSIVMDIQHAHRHAAFTWTCSMHAGMRHGQEHEAWTRTYSRDIDLDINMDTYKDTDMDTHTLTNTYVLHIIPPPPQLSSKILLSQKIRLIQAPVP
jgi:hypothetical protein